MIEGFHPDLEGQGYAAAWRGIPWWRCPYPAGSREAYAWDTGHTLARLKGAKALKEFY